MDIGWTWAPLTGEQLQLLRQAEQTLGNNVKYLLVYQQAKEPTEPNAMNVSREEHIAPLSQQQFENLQ